MTPTPPGPGQESVWDYPRPPALELTNKTIVITHHGTEIARTNRAYRVLETSHPPVYYLPPQDVQMQYLRPRPGGQTNCEWKGRAHYYDLIVPGKVVSSAAWAYADPRPRFAPIKDYLAFYPSRIDRATVNDEIVKAQEGDFYGGWVTADIVGPFKGAAGTWGW